MVAQFIEAQFIVHNMYYDITRPLTPRTAIFPGDTPVSINPVAQMSAGASCNVSALTLSSHAATHIDAPRHYSDDAVGIQAISPEIFLGPARVVTIMSPYIQRTDLEQHNLAGVHRLIIHTRASTIPNDVWEADFAYFDPAAANYLGELGVRLIGTDAPSVDPATSKSLPAHKTFLHHNIIIMENLNLTGVLDGDYELIALPLSIVDCDAAPARAILRN